MVDRGLDLLDSEWSNIQAGQAWAPANAEDDEATGVMCIDYPSWPIIPSFRQHPLEQIG